MFSPLTRRDFVAGTVRAGVLAGIGDFAFLRGLPPVSANDVKIPPGIVQFSPDMEPLVRLLEDTPRDKVLEAVMERMRAGVGYQQLLAAGFWPAFAASSPDQSGSSSTPSSSSTPHIWPAWRCPTRTAGCLCSGPSIITRIRRHRTTEKQAG